MPEYDFLNLSPSEFENISRDLLQRRLNTFIESFTNGKDGGIDLRYTTSNDNSCIIQSKRYKDYAALIRNLKIEVPKVNKLKPEKYLLTTSVGLTPNNKSEILDLFKPYIKYTEDIYGKDDLNNLLAQFNEIETQYYKLWLSSTNILDKILHSKIYNQAAFELENIKDQLKLYVQNDSFNEALEILKQNNYVIISGIPGIGKTTLARTLILFLLSSEFEEFVFLPDTIDDGYEYYKDGKKQIFLFDDFLGRIQFDAKHLINAESKIVNFIEKIRKSKDKLLIFTTREYILNQARNTFEKFKISNIEIAKCILDLSSYTKIIKAQILYNHLFFSNIPQPYLQNVIDNNNYLAIINHENYNPRIIETIINRNIWEHCIPNDFTNAFKSYFDNPESVWQFAFENSLDRTSQFTLFILLSSGSQMLVQDLELAIKQFLEINNYKYLISFDSIDFNRILKELENTFIVTHKDSFDNVIIEFQNPSIQDYLLYYLKGKNDIIDSLIDSFMFSNQFFNIFTGCKIDDESPVKNIYLSDNQVQKSVNRIKKIYPELQSSSIHILRYGKKDEFRWVKDNQQYSFLYNILTEIAPRNNEASQFVHDKFQELILIANFDYFEQISYVKILSNIDLQKIKMDEKEIIQHYFEKIEWIDDFDNFVKLKNIFPNSFKEFTSIDFIKEKIYEEVDIAIDNVNNSDINDLIEQFKNIENNISIDLENKIIELQEKDDEYNVYLEEQAKEHFRELQDSNETKNLSEAQEDFFINQMFDSLTDKT